MGSSGSPTCNRILRFYLFIYYLSCSQIWLNSLVADCHFWSNMRKLGKKKKKKKKKKEKKTPYHRFPNCFRCIGNFTLIIIIIIIFYVDE